MAAPIAALIPLIGDVLDRILPDEQAKVQAKLDLLKLSQEERMAELAAGKDLALAQVETNKTEAATGNLFIGGWRPFIGWVCGVAVAYQYLLHPLLTWYASNNGLAVPPSVPSDDLFELVMLMLGVAGLRTFEKYKGITK